MSTLTGKGLLFFNWYVKRGGWYIATFLTLVLLAGVLEQAVWADQSFKIVQSMIETGFVVIVLSVAVERWKRLESAIEIIEQMETRDLIASIHELQGDLELTRRS